MKLIYTSYDQSLKEVLQEKINKLNEQGYECHAFYPISLFKKKENPKHSHIAFFIPQEKRKRLKQIERGEWINNLHDLGYQYVGHTGNMFVFNSDSNKAIIQDNDRIEDYFKVQRIFTLSMKLVLGLFLGYYFMNTLFEFDSLLDYSNNGRILSTVLPSFVAIMFIIHVFSCFSSTVCFVNKKTLKPTLGTIYFIKGVLTISIVACLASFVLDTIEYNLPYSKELPIITLEDFGYTTDIDSQTYHQASSLLLNDSYQSLQMTSDFSYEDEVMTGDLISVNYYKDYNATLVEAYFTKIQLDPSTKNVTDIVLDDTYPIYCCYNSEGIVDLVIVYSDSVYIEIASSFDLSSYLDIIATVYLQ
ncbi:hypothetical protein [Tannockella kyphosi]|uniref:hypothetical protein n=1 Tax=Tannockella kyphosi TaxID=2899121 RepID=UPI0020111BE6|nr:hypothetical protein [Tannockella kyphosi]